MLFPDRMLAYYEAMGAAWRQLSAEAQARFDEWKALYPEARNSDWPGWLQLIGPRPRAQNLEMIRRAG